MSDKLDEMIKEALTEEHVAVSELNRNIIAMAKENRKMKKIKVHSTVWKLGVAAAICFFMMVSAGVTAYAADIGGFRETINVWIKGENKEVNIEEVPVEQLGERYDDVTVRDGKAYIDVNNEEVEIKKVYKVEYENSDGTKEEKLIPYAVDGDVKKDLCAPTVEFGDDGKITVFYYDQVIDITDKFEDNICQIELQHENEKKYLTVCLDPEFTLINEGRFCDKTELEHIIEECSKY